jgi:hypothetical protein
MISSRPHCEGQRTRAAVLACIVLLDAGLTLPAVFAQSGLGWVDPPPVNPWVDPPSRQSTKGHPVLQPPQSFPQATPEIQAPAATMAPTGAVRAISRPSFNCRYAKTAVERTICADPTLAAKDGWMALLYEQAGGSRYRPVDPSQWSWLAARNRCGKVRGPALKSCIHRAYDDRIAELSSQ